MNDQDKRAIRATAHVLADAARVETLRYFRGAAFALEDKGVGRFDPVTEADRSSERAMRAILAERRPDDGILGEEYGVSAGTSGLTWVLDPVDGTRAFMSGIPMWGVLIGVWDALGPIYGLIDQPYIGERFEGGFGVAEMVGPHGTRPLRTRQSPGIAQATMLSTFPEIGTSEEHAAFRRVADRVRLVRYGLDCYGYALLAAGQVDLVIEAGLQPYDVAAPIAVIEAAGGIVTDWQGGPAKDGGRLLAAADAAIHASALELLRG
ncbi:inositol monophosphatase family protein [Paracoccus pacificus]|uniref:Inositol monophosphatase family protein n=1 Tax=Paracoccus pacificus TaxID=1463598 RepID=A0ABW4R9A9_9RHOB